MVLLINLIPVFIILLSAVIALVVRKSNKSLAFTFVSTAVLLFIYFQFQPSYMVKGEVKRTSLPAFQEKQIEVIDLQPKPMTGNDRDEKRNSLYKEPLPFLRQ